MNLDMKWMTLKGGAAKGERTSRTRRPRRKQRQLFFTVSYDAAPEGGYVAFVHGLPGCHSQGETLEEVEANIKEAIEAYLESLVAHEEPIPQERRVLQSIVAVSVPVRA